MENLDLTLGKNRQLLGSNYENLGRSVGRGFGKRKIFLSYNRQEKSWKIVKFNIIQLIVRKFGFYKSTHLKNVVYHWERHKLSYKPFDKTLEKRFQTLWQKTYPKKLPLSFALYFSNQKEVKLDSVNLILFAEKHTKHSHRKFIGEVINQFYRPGDIILVEQSDKEDLKMQNCGQLKYVKRKCIVKGWDPLQRKSEIFDATPPAEKKKELEEILAKFLIQFPKKKRFTNEDYQKIENSIDLLIKDLTPYLKYFHSKREEIEKTIAALSSIKNLAKEKKILRRNQLLKETSNALERTFILADKMRYRHFTPKGRAIVRETVAERNAALAKAILENSQPGKRVFVIAGALHLVAARSKLQANLKLVKDAMSKHNFVLAIPKQLGKKRQTKKFNPEYFRIANPFRTTSP